MKPDKITYFPLIKTSIDDSWTHIDLDVARSKKADNAPVLSELWDHRLVLMFKERKGVLRLANALRNLGLTRYR